MDSRLYYLAISMVKGIGSIRFTKLIKYFGSVENIWNADIKSFTDALGGHAKVYQEFLKVKNNMDIIRYNDYLKREGIKYLTIEDKDYPALLKQIYDPPIILFYKGKIISHSINIAIVGSRKCTYYGRETAKYIAGSLSKYNINIISGLARGIDTYAIQGAIEQGGYTTAVLGCGLDIIYPPENKNLYKKVSETGLLLSEYHPGTKPDGHNFPARNRIISGLSQGVVVVEAAEKSGSLITVDFALEQGREVFSVPGNINSKYSVGTNKLIKQGAKIVTDIDSILEEFDLKCKQETSKGGTCHTNSQEEKKILEYVTFEPLDLDELALKTGLSLEKLNTFLTLLEVKGLIKQISGKKIIRNTFR